MENMLSGTYTSLLKAEFMFQKTNMFHFCRYRLAVQQLNSVAGTHSTRLHWITATPPCLLYSVKGAFSLLSETVSLNKHTWKCSESVHNPISGTRCILDFQNISLCFRSASQNLLRLQPCKKNKHLIFSCATCAVSGKCCSLKW